LGIEAGQPDPAPFVKGSIVRDAAGKPTGIIRGDIPATRPVQARLPKVPPDQLEAATADLLKDMNQAGLTSIGVPGCIPDVLQILEKWKTAERLNLRTFCIEGSAPGTPEQVEQYLPQISKVKVFQGDSFIDTIFFGESVYGPLHDPMFALQSNPPAEQ